MNEVCFYVYQEMCKKEIINQVKQEIKEISNLMILILDEKRKTYEKCTGKIVSMSTKHNICYMSHSIFIDYGQMMTDKIIRQNISMIYCMRTY
jgi:replicative DNA helicase